MLEGLLHFAGTATLYVLAASGFVSIAVVAVAAFSKGPRF